MINIQQLFIPDPGFGYAQAPPADGGVLEQLRALAQQYCPEELQTERKAILPDEELHLEELEAGFKALLGGGSPFPDLSPGPLPQGTLLPKEDGFGIGIPESQKLRNMHYEEVDTLNSEQIKKDFPVLQQKVNGHDLVWLDNGATTQKPNQVIDKISDYYRTYNSNIHRGHTHWPLVRPMPTKRRERRCNDSSTQQPVKRLSSCAAPLKELTSSHSPMGVSF